MEVFDGHRSLLRPLSAPAIAIGNFDGVHAGHRALLGKAIECARRLGGDAVALTFDPHPARVLAPDLAPTLITPRERKLELIAEAGIDVAVVEPFTRELAGLAPDAFLRQILVETLQAREVVVGYDFSYGKKRAGTVKALKDYGEEHGFITHVIEPITVNGLVASSTKVRNFATTGKLDGVRMLLGRDHDVDGTVVEGAKRGRSLGFRTANLRISSEQLLPAPGVYAVRTRILDDSDGARVYSGVANLGTNPTFVAEGQLALEVHFFDFDRDIYGRRLRVSFVERIRGERRFDGVDELVRQIAADADRAREILNDTTAAGQSGTSDDATTRRDDEV